MVVIMLMLMVGLDLTWDLPQRVSHIGCAQGARTRWRNHDLDSPSDPASGGSDRVPECLRGGAFITFEAGFVVTFTSFAATARASLCLVIRFACPCPSNCLVRLRASTAVCANCQLRT